jgi:hypothetical protein
MKQFFYSITVISVLLLYSSCQKELSDTAKQREKTCKLISATYYLASGPVYDSSAFVYNSDKVLKAESDVKTISYSYNGSNISIRSYFDKLAKSVSFTDTTEYDLTNRIKKLTVWFYPGIFTPETTNITYLFSYKGTAIDKITSIQQYHSNASTPDTLYNLFRVDAAGNIENIVTVDDIGNVYDSVHYAYDRNPNYFKKIHPNYFIFDANFQFQGSYLHHLPYFFSANNVTEFSYYANSTYQVSYQLDSLKNLTQVSVNGAPYATYQYECR